MKQLGETDVSIQGFRNCAPRFSQILFAIFGEQSRKGRFLEKCATLVVHLGKLVNLPLRENKSQLQGRAGQCPYRHIRCHICA